MDCNKDRPEMKELSFNFGSPVGNNDESEKVEITPSVEDVFLEESKPQIRRKAECLKLTQKHLYRRAFSEQSLVNAKGLEFKEGDSYHFLTAGDVDAVPVILNEKWKK